MAPENCKKMELNHSDAETGIFGGSWVDVMAADAMAPLPDHHKPWQYKVKLVLVFMKKDFNYLGHISIEKQ